MSNLAASHHGVAAEARLRTQAMAWDAPTAVDSIPWATEEDVPVLDLGAFFAEGGDGGPARDAIAMQLRAAASTTGFHYVTNHEVPDAVVRDTFAAARAFHALPVRSKQRLAMDRPETSRPAGDTSERRGCGYLSEANMKLPAREKPNRCAAFVVKREIGPRNITLDKMPWPCESSGDGGNPDSDGKESGGGGEADDESDDAAVPAGFRATIERYCLAMEKLGLAMLPIYAVALGLPPTWFDAAFTAPLFRLRLSRYSPTPPGEYGINPHVDTSFFTILATSAPGLVVWSNARGGWLRVRHRDDAFVINGGELLSQITNDKFPATRHYAIFSSLDAVADADKSTQSTSSDNRISDGDFRYSLPFFFNATPTYRMEVVPTCCSADNPPKYPPLSYLEGQAIAQGE